MRNHFIFLFLCFCFLVYGLAAHEKWIVVTTIQYPTKQLQALSKIPGWRLVVVGDKKTPNDWFLENCDYLSPKKQLELGYKLAKLLPWNHYSRKNIGYLYAIENGAKVIYETDDDNEPSEGLLFSKPNSLLPEITGTHSCINMYAYFGQPGVWPRGFPLSHITASNQFSLTSPKPCQVGIEQGVVDECPDVDALFRLTQDKSIFFEKKPPCYLPKGVYCPFNSQNTFFHASSFPALYLPSTVSMRVSDIWRGYIAQRLIWEWGQNLVFSGPSAIQKRNEHNLFQDYLQEEDLYKKSHLLVQTLSDWKNPFLKEPNKAMADLFKILSKNNFIKSKESELLEVWLQDLEKASLAKSN